jgi:hypothetical protein
MYSRLLLLIFTASFNVTFSQNEAFKFGDISLEDLKMVDYEKDTSAAAVMLLNNGSINVDINSTAGTIFTKHTRIKIFRKSAFDEWGSFKASFQKNGLRKFKAITYNIVNGKIDKSEINADHFFKDKRDKYTEEITFAFPNVKEGSIIEFEYSCMYENAYYPKWQFQYTIPVVRSEFVYVGPASINQLLSGPIQPKSHVTKHNGSRHEWLMLDIPAFKSEPHMPNKEAYLSTLKVDRARTWGDISVDLMQKATVGKILLQDSYLNGKVKDLTAGMTQPIQKIKVISDYVKEAVTWNGIRDYTAYDPHTVVEKKSGSAGDINLLFASLLKKAGLNVGLVFLSTRENGYIMQEFPSRSQFDYVICHIALEGRELLLDATEKNLPYDMLPPRCFNHKGFLVSLEHYGWIGIEPAKREKISLDAKIILSANGQLTGKVAITNDGYAAFASRVKLDSGEQAYKKNSFVNKISNIQRSEIINTKEIEKPLIESYEITMDGYGSQSNDLIYFNPFLFLREESNPFVQADREYPIDFSGITDRLSVYNITIPDGYAIEELPQSKVFTLPENAAKCTFNISVNSNTIVVMTRLQINKTLFYQDEYPNLREFYARVVAKNSENVVLKKKS